MQLVLLGERQIELRCMTAFHGAFKAVETIPTTALEAILRRVVGKFSTAVRLKCNNKDAAART